MTSRRFLAALALSLSGIVVVASGCSSSSAGSSSASESTTTTANAYGTGAGRPTSEVILDAQARTVLDQLIAYPGVSQAQVSAAVLTFEPGARTGLHRHDAPLFVYVLEGTITVTYDGGVVKELSAGMGFLEAIGTAHEGENRTDGPVRLLAVNVGAQGVTNTVSL